MNISRLDFCAPDSPAKFVQSLKNTGFAVISNHMVMEGLLKDVYNDWREFFAYDEKKNYLFNPATHAGYFPFKSENAKGYPAKDLKEFFHIYSKDDIPRIIDQTATVIVRNQLISTAEELLIWLDENTPKGVFKSNESLFSMIDGSKQSLLRILHYPPLKGEVEEGAVRAAAHEDINLITLLPAATQPGLEVQDVNGNWHKVEAYPGDIIVNAGDMLQLTTNGYFKSTTHRVVNPDGPEALKSRYSLPLFMHPRPEVLLNKNKSAGQYLSERLQEIGLK